MQYSAKLGLNKYLLGQLIKRKCAELNPISLLISLMVQYQNMQVNIYRGVCVCTICHSRVCVNSSIARCHQVIVHDIPDATAKKRESWKSYSPLIAQDCVDLRPFL